MKEIICLQCGKSFLRYRSQIKKYKHSFCCRKCKAEWNKTQSGFWKGKKMPFYKRPNRDVKGDKNGRWKGGRRIDKDGYVLIHSPNHPNSDYHGYVREHRLVMEKIIGRYLDSQEVVHHEDGDKQNNRPDNLKLYNGLSEHQIEHNRKRRDINSKRVERKK